MSELEFWHAVTGTSHVDVPWWMRPVAVVVIAVYVLRAWAKSTRR